MELSALIKIYFLRYLGLINYWKPCKGIISLKKCKGKIESYKKRRERNESRVSLPSLLKGNKPFRTHVKRRKQPRPLILFIPVTAEILDVRWRSKRVNQVSTHNCSTKDTRKYSLYPLYKTRQIIWMMALHTLLKASFRRGK